ncbi:MAG: YraN family protein [Syntrophobacteraceae bacterium]
MRTRIDKGRKGEDIAAAFLKEQGLELLEQNVRCAIGEIDLVAKDGRTLVFVEVRSRSGSRFGLPQESISPAKQRRLTQLAKWYLQRHRLEDRPARFDVIAIRWVLEEPDITWIPNAFEARE